MASDLIPPVPDDTSLNFIIRNWLFKMRRNVNQFVVDISTLVAKIATAISPTNPLTSSNISTYVNTQTISNTYVADATLTGTKLVNGTITGTQIANTTITDSNIVNSTITGGKIANATITDANISSLNADKITAGSIRGININAASHTTKGTYLTAATVGADTTVTVKDTSDFPASGTAVVFDTTNDRDQFTYTGKTGTTFTGCSGVLAHNNRSTIVPLAKCITIDDNVNEMRFLADRGDGTIEELISAGLYSPGGFTSLLRVGSTSTGTSLYGITAYSDSGTAITGSSVSLIGVNGISSTSTGVSGTGGGANPGVKAENLSTGPALSCFTSTGYAGVFNGNSTKGHIRMPPLAGRPSDKSDGNLAVIYTTGGTTDNRTATPKLMIADGTNWRLVEDYTVWAG